MYIDEQTCVYSYCIKCKHAYLLSLTTRNCSGTIIPVHSNKYTSWLAKISCERPGRVPLAIGFCLKIEELSIALIESQQLFMRAGFLVLQDKEAGG